MRFLQFLTLSGLMVAGNVALAASIDNSSVPNRCWEVCGQVVGISHKCENLQRHKNVDEVRCMCDWERASIMIPQCEACIAYYNNDHNNAVYNILTSCSMSTTTWRWAPATTTLNSVTRATDTVMTTTAVPTTATASTASETQDSTASSATASETPAATENPQSSSNANVNSETPSNAATNINTASNAQQTDNAAPGSTIPRAASLAAAVGLISFAWL